MSRQQKVAKGIQGPQTSGVNLLVTGFTSTLLSSQRTTAPEAEPPSEHSFNFTLALPPRQIPEIAQICVAKSSSPAKRPREPYIMIRRSITWVSVRTAAAVTPEGSSRSPVSLAARKTLQGPGPQNQI